MSRFAAFRFSSLVAVGALSISPAVLAHHGWAWTEDEESRLSGTIEEIQLGNPHAGVALRNEQGVWAVDLAPPSSTERAGFVKGVAAVGDEATVTGHRSRDKNERRFKAETITVKGKTYDVYPNRPKNLKPAP